MRWLGQLAGPGDLTAANMAAYHTHLVAGGRSSATVRKDRAALNSLLRWLADHELLPAGQAREAPKALSAGQYERLVREAKARIADDPLAGTRDLAIVLVLGDAGLRCEELAALERRDFLPARRGCEAARPRRPARKGRSPAPRVAQRRGNARDRALGPRPHARAGCVLAAAYATTPERFVRRAPTPPPVPAAAWINKPNNEEVAR